MLILLLVLIYQFFHYHRSQIIWKHRWDWSLIFCLKIFCFFLIILFVLLLFGLRAGSSYFGSFDSLMHFYHCNHELSSNLDLIKKSPFAQPCHGPCAYRKADFSRTVRCKGIRGYLAICSGMSCLVEVARLWLNHSSGLAAWNLMVVRRSCRWRGELCRTVHAPSYIGGASQDWMRLMSLVSSHLVIWPSLRIAWTCVALDPQLDLDWDDSCFDCLTLLACQVCPVPPFCSFPPGLYTRNTSIQMNQVALAAWSRPSSSWLGSSRPAFEALSWQSFRQLLVRLLHLLSFMIDYLLKMLQGVTSLLSWAIYSPSFPAWLDPHNLQVLEFY